MDRLVLFDIDKTLIVGSRVHYNALKSAISEVYRIDEPPSLKDLQGMTDLKIICTTLLEENIDIKTIKSGLDECMKLMYLNYKDALQKNDLMVLEGVRELLDKLQSLGIHMGLVTGNMQEIAWLKMEKVGLKDYFQFGAFGDSAMERSSIVERALEVADMKWGKIKRENIFLIGDTPRDIVGGQKIGIRTVGVATGDFSYNILSDAGAEFVFENLCKTDEIIKAILH